jgi:phage gpG-like protein
MITMEMTGKFPQLNSDFLPEMEKISLMMYDSVEENFIAGGRPNQWPPLKKTGLKSHLIKTGALLASITSSFDKESARVGTNTNEIPYAAVHQFGYPPKNIPMRQYLMFQESDKQAILEIISTAIFSTPERRPS